MCEKGASLLQTTAQRFYCITSENSTLLLRFQAAASCTVSASFCYCFFIFTLVRSSSIVLLSLLLVGIALAALTIPLIFFTHFCLSVDSLRCSCIVLKPLSLTDIRCHLAGNLRSQVTQYVKLASLALQRKERFGLGPLSFVVARNRAP